jgi:hypothetical protein
MGPELVLTRVQSWVDLHTRIRDSGYTLTYESGRIPLQSLCILGAEMTDWVGFHPGSLIALDIRRTRLSSWRGYDPGGLRQLTIMRSHIVDWRSFQAGNLDRLNVLDGKISSFRLLNCKSIRVIGYGDKGIPGSYYMTTRQIRALYPIHVYVITRAVLRRWVRRYRWRQVCMMFHWNADSNMARDLYTELFRTT